VGEENFVGDGTAHVCWRSPSEGKGGIRIRGTDGSTFPRSNGSERSLGRPSSSVPFRFPGLNQPLA